MNNVILKIALITLFLATSINTNALIINNYTSKVISAEIMDCPSYEQYNYPSTWLSVMPLTVQDPATGQWMLMPVPFPDKDLYRDKVKFLFKTEKISIGSSIVVDQSEFTRMPSEVCIKVTGHTGNVIVSKIKNFCEITIEDNGFLRGIKASYNNCN